MITTTVSSSTAPNQIIQTGTESLLCCSTASSSTSVSLLRAHLAVHLAVCAASHGPVVSVVGTISTARRGPGQLLPRLRVSESLRLVGWLHCSPTSATPQPERADLVIAPTTREIRYRVSDNRFSTEYFVESRVDCVTGHSLTRSQTTSAALFGWLVGWPLTDGLLFLDSWTKKILRVTRHYANPFGPIDGSERLAISHLVAAAASSENA